MFKTLAISKVVYISTMKNPPRQFIETLNEVQQDFLWSKSHSKIKHSSLIGNYEEGGYKDVDISTKLTALKITWIRRFLRQLPSMEDYSRKVICFRRWLLLFSLEFKIIRILFVHYRENIPQFLQTASSSLDQGKLPRTF